MALFDWNASLESIPDDWRNTKGKGVKIAILDTGADLTHPALKHLDKDGRKFDVTKDGFDPNDLTGKDSVTDDWDNLNPHGTKMLSIIAGQVDSQSTEQINGVTTDADIYIIKAGGVGKEMTVERLLLGLELAIKLDVDIISVSYIPSEDATPDANRVKAIFTKIKDKNILLCATLRNAKKIFPIFNKPKHLPAVRDESIQIGMLYTQLLNRQGRNIKLSDKIEFILPQFGVTYCERANETPYQSGDTSCSIATAVVAGIFALLLSAERKKDATFSRFSKKDAIVKIAPCRKEFDFDTFLACKSLQFFSPKKTTQP